MPFWSSKEKNLIPPVQSEDAKRNELLGSRGNSTSPRPPSNFSRASSTTYVASRDGDPYASTMAPQNNYGAGDRYARQNAVGDVYSRGQGNVDQDRNELFGGYQPPKGGSGRFFDDGPAAGGRPGRRGTPPPGEENEEDVEGIKQDLRYLKQDSVNSTRNALRLAREAEETARNTIGKLGSQSGEYRAPSAAPAPLLPLSPSISASDQKRLRGCECDAKRGLQRNSRTRSATWTCRRATRCGRRTRRTS